MEIMRQYRILVVDDDQSILKLVKNVLELDAYDVTLDRIEELELTHFVGYDLILLDVMMEPVNGFELCSYIRPSSFVPNHLSDGQGVGGGQGGGALSRSR